MCSEEREGPDWESSGSSVFGGVAVCGGREQWREGGPGHVEPAMSGQVLRAVGNR